MDMLGLGGQAGLNMIYVRDFKQDTPGSCARPQEIGVAFLAHCRPGLPKSMTLSRPIQLSWLVIWVCLRGGAETGAHWAYRVMFAELIVNIIGAA